MSQSEFEEARKSAIIVSSCALEPGVLRGVTSSILLSGSCAHFKNNSGLQGGFELSSEQAVLDNFISHSWRTHRIHKAAGLMLLFNGPLAACASVISAAFWFVMEMSNLVAPVAERDYTLQLKGEGTVKFAPYALLSVSSIFWLVLLHGQRLVSAKQCFLDKLCISQDDPVLKQAGIRSLGAILDHSKQMTLLWSQEYFSRLWCVFEVSSLLRSETGASKLEFVPMALATATLSAAAVTTFQAVVSSVVLSVNPITDLWLLNGLAFLGICVTLVVVGAKYARSRKRLDADLATFDVRSTQCFMESDRLLVYEVLRTWYGSDDDDGLDTFNITVRENLRRKVRSTFGSIGEVPYRVAVMVFLPNLGSGIEFIAMYRGVFPPDELGFYTIFYVWMYLFAGPMTVWLLFFVACWVDGVIERRRLSPNSCCTLTVLVVVAVLLAFVALGFFRLGQSLILGGFIPTAVVSAMSVGLALLVFRRAGTFMLKRNVRAETYTVRVAPSSAVEEISGSAAT